MRKEPFSAGNFVHIIRRGGRGLPIVKDESDKWRHLKILFYLNDHGSKDNWYRDVEDLQGQSGGNFVWPITWFERQTLFSLVGFTLLDNHLHIIALEKTEHGISKFMKKSGISAAKYHNEKYKEKGSLFQG